MIKIKCEYRLSKKCTGHRMVKERYLKTIKHPACKPCISIFLSQKQNTERAIAQSSSHRPAAKEVRKPNCDYYYECLTAAGLANKPTVGCKDCERESYTPKTQFDAFSNMNADEYYTLSSDVWRGIQGAI